MAGYALGFDDGGVIPTDNDDGSPNPLAVDQGSPEQQDPPQENVDQGGQPGFVPGGAPGLGQQINGGVKKIAAYLTGEGAADPQSAQKMDQGVKHEHPGISDEDAYIMAVHKATEFGGPAAGWAMVQYNRQAYNAKASFARAALNGVDGKAGNAQAAALAATQAGAHILDGSSTVFTADPGRGGFTATVKVPGSNHTIGYRLTPEQFNKALDVGGEGMWDKVMEQGTPQTLQKISAVQAPDAGASGQDQAQDNAQDQGDATPPAVRPTAGSPAALRQGDDFRHTDKAVVGGKSPDGAEPAVPGTHDAMGHSLSPDAPDQTNYGDELESRAEAQFGPKGNLATRQARGAYMDAQEEKDLERTNKLDVATEKGKADLAKARQTGADRVAATTIGSENRREGQVSAAKERASGTRDAATINATARTQGYAQRAMIEATKQASRNTNAQANEANKNFRAFLASSPGASDDDVNKAATKYGVQLPGTAAPQATTPQAVAPQAAPPTGRPSPAPATPSARPANVPAGARFFQGQWYTRGPGGSAVAVQ